MFFSYMHSYNHTYTKISVGPILGRLYFRAYLMSNNFPTYNCLYTFLFQNRHTNVFFTLGRPFLCISFIRSMQLIIIIIDRLFKHRAFAPSAINCDI